MMVSGWLARLRIGPKLLLAPALLLLLLMLSSAGAYWAMLHQNASLEHLVTVRAGHIKDANDLLAQARAAHAGSYQLLTWISASVSAARIGALEADIGRRHRALAQRLATLARDRAEHSVERGLLARAALAHANYVDAVHEVIELAGGDQSIAANAMVRAEQAFDGALLPLAALAEHEQRLSELEVAQTAHHFRLIRWLMPALAGLSIILSLCISMAVRRALLREVSQIGQAAQGLASGDLTASSRSYGDDEIGDTSRTLDASIRSLNGTLRDIMASARSIDSTSRDIASGNAHLSERAGLQVQALGQTNATVEQLGTTLNQNAGNALAARQLAADASRLALRGADAIDTLASTHGAVEGGVQHALTVLGELDQLMTQTLQAEGRADAARALAQRSAALSERIRVLLAQAAANMDRGRAAADQAGGSMATIASMLSQAGAMIDLISVASAQQASGISNVSVAIVQMDHMTQKNAALVQEAATAAASLQQQALRLSQAVAGFTLDAPAKAGTKGKPHLSLAASRD